MTSTDTAAQILSEQAAALADLNPAQIVATVSQATADKLDFVKTHAMAYMDAGWDVVIETCSNEQIVAAIGKARSKTGAVNNVRAAIVEPWVMQLIETRPGEADDPQLETGRKLEAEREANWYDATKRLTGDANTVKPPKRYAPRIVPVQVDEVLTEKGQAAAGEGDGGRTSPEGDAKPAPKPRRTRKPRTQAAKAE